MAKPRWPGWVVAAVFASAVLFPKTAPAPPLPCGGPDQPCCTSGTPCTSPSFSACVNGVCVACGNFNDPCCAVPPSLHLCHPDHLECVSDRCVGCGGINELCCTGIAVCDTSDSAGCDISPTATC